GAIHDDRPSEWLDQSDDHVKRRRLTGAIRAQQSYNLPLLQSKGHVVDDAAPTVRLDQPTSFQDAATACPDRLSRRRSIAVRGWRNMARRTGMLARLLKRGCDLVARARDLLPDA